MDIYFPFMDQIKLSTRWMYIRTPQACCQGNCYPTSESVSQHPSDPSEQSEQSESEPEDDGEEADEHDDELETERDDDTHLKWRGHLRDLTRVFPNGLELQG